MWRLKIRKVFRWILCGYLWEIWEITEKLLFIFLHCHTNLLGRSNVSEFFNFFDKFFNWITTYFIIIWTDAFYCKVRNKRLWLSYSIKLLFSVLYNLGNLTGTITSTFMATQTLKRNVQEELRLTHDPPQRHELEYLLQRFESLNPMSAGGYFTVNKGSLTSMLSVRFKKYFAKNFTISPLFQFDLHHYFGPISSIKSYWRRKEYRCAYKLLSWRELLSNNLY